MGERLVEALKCLAQAFCIVMAALGLLLVIEHYVRKALRGWIR